MQVFYIISVILLASGKIFDSAKAIQQAITSVQANGFHVFLNILPTQFGLSINLACLIRTPANTNSNAASVNISGAS
jgi:hypothetical protein